MDAAPDIDVPDALLPPERLDELISQRQPAYVPLPGATAVSCLPFSCFCLCCLPVCLAHFVNWACGRQCCACLLPQVDNTPDPATGVVRLQLSNGIKVNFRRTDNEPQAAMIRMVAAGGRACEGTSTAGTGRLRVPAADKLLEPTTIITTLPHCACDFPYSWIVMYRRPRTSAISCVGDGIGPGGAGVVSIGARALSESGTVGSWQRSQVELFCISKLINCVLESDEEFVCMDLHFAVGESAICLLFSHHPLAMPAVQPSL